MFFSIFAGSPVLAQFFSIEFLLLFYAVLSLLELFLIYIFCSWVFYFFDVFIFMFNK